MAPIAAFIQRSTGKAVTEKRASTKIWKELKTQILDTYHNPHGKVFIADKLGRSAPGSSASYKNDDDKADKHRPRPHSCSLCRHRRHRRDGKRWSTLSRSTKLDGSCSESKYDFHCTKNGSLRELRSRGDGPIGLCTGNSHSCNAPGTTTIVLSIGCVSMMTVLQCAALGGQNDYKYR